MTLKESLEVPRASDPAVCGAVNAYLYGQAVIDAYGPKSGRVWQGERLVSIFTGLPIFSKPTAKREWE